MIGTKLGGGREADVHAWGDDAVVKLYHPGFGGHGAEALALAALDGYGIAPMLLDTVECDGRTGLVLERLPGADMLSSLRRRPWRVPAMARALAYAQLAVHQIPAPARLPDLRQVLATRIRQAVLPPHLRSYALRVLDVLPEGDRLCHGDYHPGNALVNGDRIAVIDWPDAARGMPEADHARTMLLLRWSASLPGTPPLSRALIVAVRSAFASRYERAYRNRSPQRLRHLDGWLVVHTAARLAEEVDNERAVLINLLDRAHRRSNR